jgi:HK97 family phage portal protein
VNLNPFSRRRQQTQQERAADLAATEIALRGGRGGHATGSVDVNADTALRQSAVWACVRLRADHMSTLPVDTYRDHDGIAVEVTKKPIFDKPGGKDWPWHDWVWASQSDLDRTGNAVGVIREKNAMGLPMTIELANSREVSVRVRKENVNGRQFTVVTWRIGHEEFGPQDIWHERQFPVSGFILGLSPIAYAAWSIGEAMSMQEFALKWFGQGGVPRARLTNTQKTIKPAEATVIKDRWRSSVVAGDLFVTGNDWSYDLIQAEQAGLEWVEGRKFSVPEICRFMGCPADMIDGAANSGGGEVNYANITQKNLQFLIHHLGPAVIRREKNWSSGMLPQPVYVKLNTDALLRMDPQSRQDMIKSQLESRQITITEARALDNRPKYTKAQEDEVMKYFPPKGSAPASGGGGQNPFGGNGNGNSAPGQQQGNDNNQGNNQQDEAA